MNKNQNPESGINITDPQHCSLAKTGGTALLSWSFSSVKQRQKEGNNWGRGEMKPD
jgi:hypothetical protein